MTFVSDSAQPGANTAAVATLPANPTRTIAGRTIHFGYDADPTGGLLTLKDGTTIISKIPVTSKGAGFLTLSGFGASAGNTLSATLGAGGSGIIGYVALSGEYE